MPSLAGLDLNRASWASPVVYAFRSLTGSGVANWIYQLYLLKPITDQLRRAFVER